MEYQGGNEMPRFSILTSVHVAHDLKRNQLERCEKSLMAQFHNDFEWILVDDGSVMDISCDADWIKLIKQPHHERIIAMNKALEEARGEWILFLDSDDELMSYALEAISQMIEANPKYNMFNYGSIHVRRNFSAHIRDAFKPKKEKVGHEVFGGGNIVNGTFVFHRSVYDKLGGFPPTEKIKDPSNKRDWLYMVNPWDFSIAAQMEFPEIKPYFTAEHPDHPKGLPKELGNPWGNDFYIFYKYTRKYHSKPYDVPLLVVHHEGKHNGEHHKIETD